MIYRTWAPHPRLAPHVECFWYLRRHVAAGEPPDRILPDGRTELIFRRSGGFLQANTAGSFVAQPAAMLVGQISRFIVLRATGETEVIAARFTPAGARAFFRLDLNEITDGHAELDEIGPEWDDVAARLAETARPAAQVRLLERELLRRLAGSELRVARTAAALRLIEEAEGAARIGAVARAVGLSERQLERAFRRDVGLAPKQFARLTRFRRMLAVLDRGDPRWADLAARAGYSDQSHLVREFREFAGLAPRACLAGQTPFAAALVG